MNRQDEHGMKFNTNMAPPCEMKQEQRIMQGYGRLRLGFPDTDI